MISDINDKLEQLTDLLSKSTRQMTFSQRNFAKKLVEGILNIQLRLECENRRLKSRLSNIQHEEYDTALLKCLDVLNVLGVSLSWMNYYYKKKYLDFILKNKSKIGLIDVERLNNICRIIRYYEITREEMPESLDDLKQSTDEIRLLRNQKIDIDEKIKEMQLMNSKDVEVEFKKMSNEY